MDFLVKNYLQIILESVLKLIVIFPNWLSPAQSDKRATSQCGVSFLLPIAGLFCTLNTNKHA